MATTRERIEEVLDQLPEEQLELVLTYVRRVSTGETIEAAPCFTEDDLAADPLLRVLMEAPEDDEPLTDEDLAAIAEGKADIERGDIVSAEAMKRRFGLRQGSKSGFSA